MKSAEQIARETILSEYGFEDCTAEEGLNSIVEAWDGQSAADIIDTIRVAIEADRAQREGADKIAADRAEEGAISVNAVLMAEQDGFITLSDHDKKLLARAREHMTVIATDLRNEDDE